MSARDKLRSFADSREPDAAIIRDGLTYGDVRAVLADCDKPPVSQPGGSGGEGTRCEQTVYTCRKATQGKPCMKDQGHRGKCSPWLDDNPRFAAQLDPQREETTAFSNDASLFDTTDDVIATLRRERDEAVGLLRYAEARLRRTAYKAKARIAAFLSRLDTKETDEPR